MRRLIVCGLVWLGLGGSVWRVEAGEPREKTIALPADKMMQNGRLRPDATKAIRAMQQDAQTRKGRLVVHYPRNAPLDGVHDLLETGVTIYMDSNLDKSAGAYSLVVAKPVH